VNGRLIRDNLLLHALSAAYHNLMPAGMFPFALLFLTCDAGEVDVNVHPSKTEVRPPSIVHARLCPRYAARTPDRDAARAGSRPPSAQPGARCRF
jgi:DNA mismatch repair protein MutL